MTLELTQTQAIGLALAGGLGVWTGSYLPDRASRNLAVAISSGVLGFAIYHLFELGKSQLQQAAQDAADLPAGVDNGPGVGGEGGGFVDQALGAVEHVVGTLSRAVDNEAPAGVGPVTNARPAVSGPHLGNPKNVYRVAGVIRSPMRNAVYKRPAFADTVLLDTAIENQDTVIRYGDVSARVLYYPNGPLSNPETVLVPGPRVTLEPGAFKELQMRVPREKAHFFTPTMPLDVSLVFAGFVLDRLTFQVADSLI